MGHQHQHDHTGSKGLSLAFWLNLSFSVIEVTGGILTNSTAIIADAFHDFMDAVAIGIAVWLEKFSGKKRTAKFSYGYKRFSLLAALGMSAFLITGAVLMSVSAIRSFSTPKEVNSLGMLALAFFGVAINGFAYLRIKNGNSSSHGHAHMHNQNSKAIMLHLLEDALGWIAVLIGAAVIYFTGWNWIDGALALGIAGFIGYNATRNLIDTLKVLLQSVPEHINIDQLQEAIGNIEGIEDVHDLHIWSMDGVYHIGSMHVIIHPSENNREDHIYAAIVQLLEQHNIQHPTIQFETAQRNCKFTEC